MKKARFSRSLIFLLLISCGRVPLNTQPVMQDAEGNVIATRFPVPEGYTRTSEPAGSFGHYLRNLPLKPSGTSVRYYNGAVKDKHNVYLAVIDMEAGTKDLQQCADAVIRLRAEYLFAAKNFEQIHFNYTNGFRTEYTKWKDGYRIKVTGNKAEWIRSAEPSDSYSTFRKYLDNVFMYAGTLSLSRELEKIPYANLQPGDVLIQGGSPGHAVIVVDMAVNPSGKKVYMLAQSYMPAQDIQVLCNPANTGSPWFELNAGDEHIITPEWTFTTEDARRFAE